MGYVEIVSIIMTIFEVFLSIWTFEYAILVFIGFFAKRKRFPERQEKLKYGIVVCARNEEKVIGELIQSVKKCDYPQDKLTVFVIAHNCTDDTARIARENGAVVFEYNNPDERTKGYALKRIFEFIEHEYGIASFDGYHVFDADNILDRQYFTKMNDAFLFYDKKCVISSFRNSKNFGANIQTAMYGMTYIVNCTFESNGRMAVGCSSRIVGAGFLFSSDKVKNGWTIINLSDDVDFTAEQILDGHKVMYCDEAMYYDEHPTTIKAMWRQRLRWAKGTLFVYKKRHKALAKNIIKPTSQSDGKPARGSSFDLISTTFPIGVYATILLIVDLTLRAIAPLFGYVAFEVWKSWFTAWAISTGIGLLVFYIIAILSYVKERKRIKGVTLGTKIGSVLLWPFFIILWGPLQIAALFTRKFTWKPIEHTNTSNFETFNAEKRDTNKEN